MDYAIIITLMILFLLKQYESTIEDKFKFCKDSYEETKVAQSIDNCKKIFSFFILIFIAEILYWVYNL